MEEADSEHPVVDAAGRFPAGIRHILFQFVELERLAEFRFIRETFCNSGNVLFPESGFCKTGAERFQAFRMVENIFLPLNQIIPFFHQQRTDEAFIA